MVRSGLLHRASAQPDRRSRYDPVCAPAGIHRHRIRHGELYGHKRARDGVIEIGGIWFSPTLQRTRAATEALFLLLSYAMDELRYRRMQWRCNALNDKSRNAARRLGFRFEGIFYNHMVVKDRNRDTAWYSILDGEWPEVRSIIQGWLDDENFDPDGRARRSLSAMMTQRGPSPVLPITSTIRTVLAKGRLR